MPRIESILSEELYRIAAYADLVRLVLGCDVLRICQTKEILRANGQLVHILIYFALRPDDSVELQHIEAIEVDMHGDGD